MSFQRKQPGVLASGAIGIATGLLVVGGIVLLTQLPASAQQATKGATDGPGLLAAMKGAHWTSPRGPVEIDPATRDIVQNVYVRKVEKQDRQLYNMEFETIQMVKDPFKAAKK